MKLIKNSILPLLLIIILMLCMAFSACAGTDLTEAHRVNKAFVGEWSRFSPISMKRYGIPFQYEFKNAEIETRITSKEGSLVLIDDSDVICGWSDFPDYVDGNEVKQATRGNCPLKTYYYSGFEWSYIDGWECLPEDGSKVVDDYITFIARKENHIVGFAVLYVRADGLKGLGEVLTDKEFPKVNGKYQNVSEKTVNERIDEVIELHKASAD